MADEDNINITVTADASQAASEVSDTADDISVAFDDMSESGREAGDALQEGVGEGANKATEELEAMREELGGIGGAIEGVRDEFTAMFEFTGLRIGRELLEEFNQQFKEMSDRTVEFTHMSEEFGATTQSIQGLSAIADQAGVSQQQLYMALSRLSMEMEQASQGSTRMQEQLEAVGITEDDLTNKNFTAVDALVKLANSGASAGELIQLLSRRGMELGAIFPYIKNGVSDFNAETAKLNGLLPEQINQFNQYHAEISAIDTAYENSKTKIGTFWTDLTVSWHKWWDEAKSGLMADVTEILQGINGLFVEAEKIMGGAWAETKALFTGHFGEMGKIAKDTAKDIAQTWTDLEARMLATEKAGDAAVSAIENATNKVAAVKDKGEKPQTGGGGPELIDLSGFNPTEGLKDALDDPWIDAKGVAKNAMESMNSDATEFVNSVKEKDELLQKEQETMYKMNNKAYDAMCKDMEKSFSKVGDIISSSLTHAFDEMGRKGISFGQAMKSVLTSMERDFLNMTIKNTIHWIAMQAAHLAEQRTAEAQQLVLQAGAAAKSKAVQEATAQHGILVDAKQAAAGAFQATVHIPYIGPILAPAAAAAAFAGTMAFAAFEQGGLVSDDMLANVHKNEMVLPRNISEGLQNAISGNGLSGGGGGDVHLHVHALDHNGVESFFNRPGVRDHMAKSIREAHRRGTSATRP